MIPTLILYIRQRRRGAEREANLLRQLQAGDNYKGAADQLHQGSMRGQEDITQVGTASKGML